MKSPHHEEPDVNSTYDSFAELEPASVLPGRVAGGRADQCAPGTSPSESEVLRPSPQAVCEEAWRRYREVALACGGTTPCNEELDAALRWYVDQLLENADVRVACILGEAGLHLSAKAFMAFARATDPWLDAAMRALERLEAMYTPQN